MVARFLDWFIDGIFWFGFPTVLVYHALVGNVFLNTSASDAVGLEKWGNALLSPFQYVFAGKTAHPAMSHAPDIEWEFTQRFNYQENFFPRLIASILTLPESLSLGCFVKGLAYFQSSYGKRHESLRKSLSSHAVIIHQELYEMLGIQAKKDLELFVSQEHARRPGDELCLQEEKEALQEIAKLLNQAGIVWWVDCGTLLGVYRYGGVIPWDYDLDIAVLLPDFDNVYRALQGLNPEKYEVEDWSSREFPKSYLKVYLKKTRAQIDIYHFAIDREMQELHYILSLENNIFLPESWRIRERRFKAPVSWENVFPLRKGVLDGIEVFVPNCPEIYLQRYYGEDLSPIRLWDAKKQSYEKDLSHPYWQRAHVH